MYCKYLSGSTRRYNISLLIAIDRGDFLDMLIHINHAIQVLLSVIDNCLCRFLVVSSWVFTHNL
ncbi:hypothetical protein BD777DRAFT_131856 [Yarrowia lipolytica]|nr:hypothetical protein BD777DRAFT_131856 [Yarrowia lipolytica]